ncbi:hypothetical protein MCSF7_03038 [Mycoplasmopsis columbina SF7]|uniref:Uncharacterized protein n=1 Tax=Mycoplasmopsis columbina SF7 TaxID=1037410 RepID=F9UJE9_9BACT|nr:hypothetical protein [Mycoplasmopsis columbina]EGV00492.1 hypothetical protein MCSF7_03038 [Mycoplasmopsis columbina SF7]
MKLNYFSNMSSKEKYKTVQYICNIEKLNDKNFQLASHNQNNIVSAGLKPVNKLKKTLALLSEHSKLIIEKDFLNKYGDKRWMDDLFSKATYYKYKNNAVEEFLYFYLNQ